MAYILTRDNPPRVLCKAGPAWPVRWQEVRPDADDTLPVPRDALRYSSYEGALNGRQIYGGEAAKV